jgi:CHAT domain-containing protein
MVRAEQRNRFVPESYPVGTVAYHAEAARASDSRLFARARIAMKWAWAAAVIAATWAVTGASQAQAADVSPSLLDSFRLGSGSSVLCRVQANFSGPALDGMFDRGYTIVCRDAAAPIGHLYALRTASGDPLARLAFLRPKEIECGEARPEAVTDLAGTTLRDCQNKAQGVGYRVYSLTRGKTVYVAEGLTGYDSALRLGLRTIVEDRIVPGEVAVATTSVSNPAAFARVQAGSLDPSEALAEGYRRNNSGNYADAAEFFDTLGDRASDPKMRDMLGEYLANRALQRSNLGQFQQADALFEQLASVPTRDPVQLRLRRNYMALHLVNEGDLDGAKAELARPMAPVDGSAEDKAGSDPVIDATTAQQVNRDATAALAGYQNSSLTPIERAEIIDAQAEQIRGTIARMQGDLTGAQALLTKATADLMQVREGRIAALARLRAQILGELSAVAEQGGDLVGAEKMLRDAMTMVDTEYPGSGAAQGARLRLAGFLARHGSVDPALAMYREVVQGIIANDGTTIGLEPLMRPYFELLAGQIPAHPALAADFFLASQTLRRPGVADTQSVLARALSGGSDEAARLFRQSVALTRDVERNRVELARLAALPQQTPETAADIDTVRKALASSEADQTATQASLSRFPRYRAVEGGAVTLADLQATLHPDEAYLKLAVVGPDVFAMFVTPQGATAYKADLDAEKLADMVATLRASIVVEINGAPQVSPFDVETSRALYVALMGPIAPQMAAVKNLVFEPDGAMLKLPANLLVTDDASVAAYKARAARANADPFDFRGVAWLGRTTDVSTAVSAQSFRELRKAPPSTAKLGYLGLGENAPLGPAEAAERERSVSAHGAIDCNWPAAAWNNPIKPAELVAASKAVGGQGDEVVTGAAFNDTALIERTDLSQYRIIHFATHGLVTAPRPECPARPALLTSFGPKLPDGTASDGLLSFREVYDLKLDADLVILSACDTAGAASVAATKEAGETSGGGTSLDGLVRAFVGAGGRSVLASHWPVPDEYQATERLFSQIFAAPRGTSIGDALRASEVKLMDDAATSHPYYWSAFALVGDGEQPLLRPAG